MKTVQHGTQDPRWRGHEGAADVDPKVLADDQLYVISFKLTVGLAVDGTVELNDRQIAELRRLVPGEAARQAETMAAQALTDWRNNQEVGAERHNHETVTVQVPDLQVGAYVAMQVTYRDTVGDVADADFSAAVNDFRSQAGMQAQEWANRVLNVWATKRTVVTGVAVFVAMGVMQA